MYKAISTKPATSELRVAVACDLALLRTRNYNPNLGRFTSFDEFEGPISDPASLHKYNYGNSDPINNTDPTGNASLAEVTVVAGLGISLIGFTTFGIGKLTNHPTVASIGQSVGFFGLTVAALGPPAIWWKGGAGLTVLVTTALGKLAWDIATQSLGSSVRTAARQVVISGGMSQFFTDYNAAYPRAKIPVSGQIVARGIRSEDRLSQVSAQSEFGTTPVPWIKDDIIYDFVLTKPREGELVVWVRRATSPNTTEDLGQYPIKVGVLSGLPYEEPSPTGQATKKALLAQ